MMYNISNLSDEVWEVICDYLDAHDVFQLLLIGARSLLAQVSRSVIRYHATGGSLKAIQFPKFLYRFVRLRTLILGSLGDVDGPTFMQEIHWEQIPTTIRTLELKTANGLNWLFVFMPQLSLYRMRPLHSLFPFLSTLSLCPSPAISTSFLQTRETPLLFPPTLTCLKFPFPLSLSDINVLPSSLITLSFHMGSSSFVTSQVPYTSSFVSQPLHTSVLPSYTPSSSSNTTSTSYTSLSTLSYKATRAFSSHPSSSAPRARVAAKLVDHSIESPLSREGQEAYYWQTLLVLPPHLTRLKISKLKNYFPLKKLPTTLEKLTLELAWKEQVGDWETIFHEDNTIWPPALLKLRLNYFYSLQWVSQHVTNLPRTLKKLCLEVKCLKLDGSEIWPKTLSSLVVPLTEQPSTLNLDTLPPLLQQIPPQFAIDPNTWSKIPKSVKQIGLADHAVPLIFSDPISQKHIPDLPASLTALVTEVYTPDLTRLTNLKSLILGSALPPSFASDHFPFPHLTSLNLPLAWRWSSESFTNFPAGQLKSLSLSHINPLHFWFNQPWASSITELTLKGGGEGQMWFLSPKTLPTTYSPPSTVHFTSSHPKLILIDSEDDSDMGNNDQVGLNRDGQVNTLIHSPGSLPRTLPASFRKTKSTTKTNPLNGSQGNKSLQKSRTSNWISKLPFSLLHLSLGTGILQAFSEPLGELQIQWPGQLTSLHLQEPLSTSFWDSLPSCLASLSTTLSKQSLPPSSNIATLTKRLNVLPMTITRLSLRFEEGGLDMCGKGGKTTFNKVNAAHMQEIDLDSSQDDEMSNASPSAFSASPTSHLTLGPKERDVKRKRWSQQQPMTRACISQFVASRPRLVHISWQGRTLTSAAILQLGQELGQPMQPAAKKSNLKKRPHHEILHVGDEE